MDMLTRASSKCCCVLWQWSMFFGLRNNPVQSFHSTFLSTDRCFLRAAFVIHLPSRWRQYVCPKRSHTYQTTRHHIPDDNTFHSHYRVNLKANTQDFTRLNSLLLKAAPGHTTRNRIPVHSIRTGRLTSSLPFPT